MRSPRRGGKAADACMCFLSLTTDLVVVLVVLVLSASRVLELLGRIMFG